MNLGQIQRLVVSLNDGFKKNCFTEHAQDQVKLARCNAAKFIGMLAAASPPLGASMTPLMIKRVQMFLNMLMTWLNGSSAFHDERLKKCSTLPPACVYNWFQVPGSVQWAQNSSY